MRHRQRQGFTITELLVAMALIIFIMYILAEVFSAGSTAFRNLKAVGDMNEKLRTASTTLRKLLQADHFDGSRRLSDANFWQDGPPKEGFFRIYHLPNTADSIIEGNDLDGNPLYRAVDQGLHFTAKLRGNNRGDFFRSSVPAQSSMWQVPPGATVFVPNPLLSLPLKDTRFQDVTGTTLCSSWAEIAVFTRDSGDVAEDNETTPIPTPQKLYTLYLRPRLCIPDNDLIPTAAKITVPPGSTMPGQHAEMSCYIDPIGPAGPTPPSVLYFNNPSDLTMPARRLGRRNATTGAPEPGRINARHGDMLYPTLLDEGSPSDGNDVLLTNVLSFEVRVLLPFEQWNQYYADLKALPGQPPGPYPAYDFVSLGMRQPYPGAATNPLNLPFDPNPNNGVVQQFSGVRPAMLAAPTPNNPAFMRYLNNNINTPNGAFRGHVFDTWSSAKDDGVTGDTPAIGCDYSTWTTPNTTASIPLWSPNFAGRPPIRILAVQITIRIWDANTKQTRQSSIIVDL